MGDRDGRKKGGDNKINKRREDTMEGRKLVGGKREEERGETFNK